MRLPRERAICTIASALSAMLLTGLAYAQTGTTIPPEGEGGTIEIVQQSPIAGTLGQWMLLDQQKNQEEGDTESLTLYHRPPGVYTLFVEPPDGATADIKIFRNGEFLSFVPRSQTAITLKEGEYYLLIVVHAFTRVGQVIVRTDPPGVTFTLQGPNDLSITDVTPASYPTSPEGQYTVRFHPIEGCSNPPPKSLLLEKDDRASFTVNFDCPWADERRRELQEEGGNEGDKPITVTIDGTEVTLRDVPQAAWFALHVFAMAKVGVISGYRDSEGVPTGEFGPNNPVTIAELAKMAHGASGIDETKSVLQEEGTRRPPPKNPRAYRQWFSDYIASAEERAWTIYEEGSIDPLRPATRGEVLVTLLQALEVPLRWQKGGMFQDVTLHTPYSAAIETAAEDGIVSGYEDSEGNSTGFFGSQDPVNRAEMATILHKAIETYRTAKEESFSSSPLP